MTIVNSEIFRLNQDEMIDEVIQEIVKIRRQRWRKQIQAWIYFDVVQTIVFENWILFRWCWKKIILMVKTISNNRDSTCILNVCDAVATLREKCKKTHFQPRWTDTFCHQSHRFDVISIHVQDQSWQWPPWRTPWRLKCWWYL